MRRRWRRVTLLVVMVAVGVWVVVRFGLWVWLPAEHHPVRNVMEGLSWVAAVVALVPLALVIVRWMWVRQRHAVARASPIREEKLPKSARSNAAQPDRIDVFVAYGKEDEAWTRRFAESLRERGINVFLDVWSVEPGDVSVVSRGQGIEDAANGVLVFSHAAVARPEVMDDYAALLDRAYRAGRRFIPVLIDDVQLPIFARIRRPVDFTNNGDGTYEQQVDRLVRTIGAPSAAEQG